MWPVLSIVNGSVCLPPVPEIPVCVERAVSVTGLGGVARIRVSPRYGGTTDWVFLSEPVDLVPGELAFGELGALDAALRSRIGGPIDECGLHADAWTRIAHDAADEAALARYCRAHTGTSGARVGWALAGLGLVVAGAFGLWSRRTPQRA